MKNVYLSAMALLISVSAQAGMAERISRTQVEGIDLIVYPTAVKDVVTIVGSLPAGDAYAAEGNAAVPTLTGMMLDRGTSTEDKFAIAQKLENVGASIGFGVNNQDVDIRARCLAKDLSLVIGLIAEQLRAPAFSAAELEKARQQFIGELRTSIDNTNFRAHDAFNRAVYPAGHPNRQPSIDELLKAAQSATLAEVKAFHQKFYGPAHLTLVFVGDVQVPRVKREISAAFAAWRGGADVLRAGVPAHADAARTESVSIAGKSSVTIMLGQATGLRYRDADSLALRVGTAILGTGFTGRLMSTVRDREGLTYGIGAGIAEDTFNDGTFGISATFAPQLLDKGLASTRRELHKWWADGVSAEELSQRKQSMIGTYQVSLSTTGGLAAAILAAEQRGLGPAWLDQYPGKIRALTLEQVNSAIRTRLDPQKMVLVRAGTFGPGTAP